MPTTPNHAKLRASKQEENGRPGPGGVQGFGKDKGACLPICHRPLLRTSACLIIDERRRLPGSELSELFRSVGPCPGGQPHYWTMRGGVRDRAEAPSIPGNLYLLAAEDRSLSGPR